MEQYVKKGYLNSEFRLFHLTDQETREVEYHYHDFDKITIFIKGNVNYMVEGKSYELIPYDIVLVKHNDIHRLIVDNSTVYERIIVYISPNFINAYQTDSYDLSLLLSESRRRAFQRSSHPIPGEKFSVPLHHPVGKILFRRWICSRIIPPGPFPGIHDTSEPRREKEPAGIH